MIAENSIQRVFESTNIVEVIRDFVELKKSGSNWKGLSPFTQERTPSFMVSPAKQIFKCFSSGKGGGAITFLQEHKSMTFPEAIEYLAQKYNIQLVYEGKEQTEEERDAAKRLELALRSARNRWQKALHQEMGQSAMEELLENRKLTEDTITEWELGFAPDMWDYIKDPLLQASYYNEGIELGLIKRKGERNYDVFRNRIIFPIHNHKAELVGFGGRDLSGEKEAPKYLNSKESKVFNKSAVLYGLDKAWKAIKEEGFVYLTEGNFDVISMHQAGLRNTVATCGTSLTDVHAKLLKRYTKEVILLRDGDTAGRKAALRDLKVLMKLGFKVEICNLEEGEDPDSICRELSRESGVGSEEPEKVEDND